MGFQLPGFQDIKSRIANIKLRSLFLWRFWGNFWAFVNRVNDRLKCNTDSDQTLEFNT